MKKVKLLFVVAFVISMGMVGLGAANYWGMGYSAKYDGVSCPGETKIAQMLNATVSDFHNNIKKAIISDLGKEFIKDSNCKNPDICVDGGYIVFDCGNGKSYKTDVKLDTYAN